MSKDKRKTWMPEATTDIYEVMLDDHPTIDRVAHGIGAKYNEAFKEYVDREILGVYVLVHMPNPDDARVMNGYFVREEDLVEVDPIFECFLETRDRYIALGPVSKKTNPWRYEVDVRKEAIEAGYICAESEEPTSEYAVTKTVSKYILGTFPQAKLQRMRAITAVDYGKQLVTHTADFKYHSTMYVLSVRDHIHAPELELMNVVAGMEFQLGGTEYTDESLIPAFHIRAHIEKILPAVEVFGVDAWYFDDGCKPGYTEDKWSSVMAYCRMKAPDGSFVFVEFDKYVFDPIYNTDLISVGFEFMEVWNAVVYGAPPSGAKEWWNILGTRIQMKHEFGLVSYIRATTGETIFLTEHPETLAGAYSLVYTFHMRRTPNGTYLVRAEGDAKTTPPDKVLYAMSVDLDYSTLGAYTAEINAKIGNQGVRNG